ncbi:Rid family hydrolase [Pseudaestuariivita sp.]|uniref:Rid family hydrolase n=1 Tax=Pseudaestuariivita sp. TaxID=2211669 RepID=UPI00405940A2
MTDTRANREVIAPAALAEAVAATGFSPAVRAGDVVYFTGATGGEADGTMPEDAATQTRNALEKVRLVLAETDADLGHIVEVTAYQTALRRDFAAVEAVFHDVLGRPLPAWTAVGVAELRRPGAVIELRIVAHVPQVS